jgi:signal transduction histidine kinase
MVTSTDITELAEARSHAETANIAKSQFLANMTHELRTPMIGILGSTELLEQSHLSQEQLESVEVIQECGKHLLAVINEILDVSKMDLGIEQLHLSPTNLSDFLYKTAAMMEALLRDKGLSFELHIDPDLPPAVLADQLKLRQVIVNLLYNAIKFTSRGLIRFEALLLQNGPDCCLQVAVADTGVGIPAGSLENIFDRFYQADNSSHREYGGTGLGLYICKQHVQMMAGQIWVESQVDQGSTFYFRIPLAVVEDNAEADSQPVEGSQKSDEFISEFTPVSVRG